MSKGLRVVGQRVNGVRSWIYWSCFPRAWCDTCEMVRPKVKKWRGNLVGVDTSSVLRIVEEARDGVVRRAGFQMNLLG